MIKYLIVINIISFIIYLIDKLLAIFNKSRISEFCLLLISFLGGSIGSLIGMVICHHKTRKIKFWTLNILFTIMWIIIYIYR